MDPKPTRLESVDFLRGIAMIVMALDHVRDFFHAARFDPLDLSRTTPFLFMTRWVTHHCAPTFVFLAGTGAFLSAARGKTPGQLSRFLLTRGLWLIVLEFTVVRFGWLFSLDYSFAFVQVIWAIGCSMVVLAGLIHLPRWAMAAIAGGMILLHNLFDGVEPASLGIFGWPWQVLHVSSLIEYAPGKVLLVFYPLIPWIGVMAAGYLFGPLLLREEADRRRTLTRLGLGIIAFFVAARGINIYGDPHPWTTQSTPVFTVLSFLDTHKYPPSLLYLCMTLGPAIAVLPLLERLRGSFARGVMVFGRVPMFYYVVHIYLIHLLAVIAAYATVGDVSFLFSTIPPGMWQNNYGFSLGVVYLVWIAVILTLYFPCLWFAGVKRRRKDPWLSYL